jgi:hypothetical protein
MSLHSLMNCTVNIKRQAQTKSATGYNSLPTLTLVTSNVPARYTVMKPQQVMVVYGKYDVSALYARIYFDSNPLVSPVLNWITYNSIDYQVLSVENAGGQLNRLWQVDCIKKPYN